VEEPGGRIRDIRVYRPSFVGMVLLVCTPFLVFGSAAAYGAWATIGLAVVWLVCFALGCAWFARRPRWVVGAGVASMLCWLVVVVVANRGG
jgi:hypothetical protein